MLGRIGDDDGPAPGDEGSDWLNPPGVVAGEDIGIEPRLRLGDRTDEELDVGRVDCPGESSGSASPGT